MKIAGYFLLTALVLTLSSCGGWLGNQEDGYMMACEKNMSLRLEPYGKEESAEDVCACSLEKVKEKWSYNEFLEKVDDPEVIKIMQDCILDITGIDESKAE